MPTTTPSAIREAIGKQRSVPNSVAALLRAVSSRIYAASDSGDWAPAVALADDIAANGTSWVGAVTQNTPAAEQVDVMAMDHTLVPTGMGDVFVSPGVRTSGDGPQPAADKAQDTDTARGKR